MGWVSDKDVRLFLLECQTDTQAAVLSNHIHLYGQSNNQIVLKLDNPHDWWSYDLTARVVRRVATWSCLQKYIPIDMLRLDNLFSQRQKFYACGSTHVYCYKLTKFAILMCFGTRNGLCYRCFGQYVDITLQSKWGNPVEKCLICNLTTSSLYKVRTCHIPITEFSSIVL